MVHFVGTGSSPDDAQGFRVLPRARAAGVADMVNEHPARIGYLDALNHLECSNSVLVLGSTEAHYAPSKVFQAVLSGRPVFALLHEASTAVSILNRNHGHTLLTLSASRMPSPETVAGAMSALMARPADRIPPVELDAFADLTARESTRTLAQALDRALARGT